MSNFPLCYFLHYSLYYYCIHNNSYVTSANGVRLFGQQLGMFTSWRAAQNFFSSNTPFPQENRKPWYMWYLQIMFLHCEKNYQTVNMNWQTLACRHSQWKYSSKHQFDKFHLWPNLLHVHCPRGELEFAQLSVKWIVGHIYLQRECTLKWLSKG